jgi:hypothetical protein
LAAAVNGVDRQSRIKFLATTAAPSYSGAPRSLSPDADFKLTEEERPIAIDNTKNVWDACGVATRTENGERPRVNLTYKMYARDKIRQAMTEVWEKKSHSLYWPYEDGPFMKWFVTDCFAGELRESTTLRWFLDNLCD